MNNMQTIRVTGKGQLKVRPDMTRITMSLEGRSPEYADTLRKSSEDTESLKDVLAAFGFARSDVKTLYFNVDTEYESYQERGVYKQRFKGYKYEHTLKVEFESDNDRLGKILYGLAHCPVKPEFRISYFVKDQEAAKNQLLAKAVTDAKEKAAVLTQAAGKMLKDIQTIDYSWGEINFEVHPMNKRAVYDCATSPIMEMRTSYDMDIEPDDVEVSDTVTIVWEIE